MFEDSAVAACSFEIPMVICFPFFDQW